jgi:hypothetical protein
MRLALASIVFGLGSAALEWRQPHDLDAMRHYERSGAILRVCQYDPHPVPAKEDLQSVRRMDR